MQTLQSDHSPPSYYKSKSNEAGKFFLPERNCLVLKPVFLSFQNLVTQFVGTLETNGIFYNDQKYVEKIYWWKIFIRYIDYIKLISWKIYDLNICIHKKTRLQKHNTIFYEIILSISERCFIIQKIKFISDFTIQKVIKSISEKCSFHL